MSKGFRVPISLGPSASGPSLKSNSGASLCCSCGIRLSMAGITNRARASRADLQTKGASLLLFTSVSKLVYGSSSVGTAFQMGGLSHGPIDIRNDCQLFLVSSCRGSGPLGRLSISSRPTLSNSFESGRRVLLSS